LALLFVGFRASSTFPLITAAWVWERTIGKIPRVLFLLAALAIILTFPLIAITRGLPGAQRTGVSQFREAYRELTDSPVVALIAETGGSIETVAHTVDLVPSAHAFERGVGYLYAALTAFPSLFWDRHPTYARGLPSAWLIETVDPAAAQQGNGLGYSFIAEAFLNFGYAGVALIGLLVGFAVVRLTRWTESGDIDVRVAVVAALLPYLLVCARAEAAVLVRPAVWYALLPYLLYRRLSRRLATDASRICHRQCSASLGEAAPRAIAVRKAF
jgi:hypothetical protein